MSFRPKGGIFTAGTWTFSRYFAIQISRSARNDNGPELLPLAIINKLDLLPKLYQTVVVPQAVYEEVLSGGQGSPGYREIQETKWLRVEKISDERAKAFLLLELDEGESETIILAEELKADVIVIDERLARRIAELRGLCITGTMGVLLKAKRLGYIKEVKPLLDVLIENSVWISEYLIRIVLEEAKEA